MGRAVKKGPGSAQPDSLGLWPLQPGIPGTSLRLPVRLGSGWMGSGEKQIQPEGW